MDAAQFQQFLNATLRPRARRPADFESGEGTDWLTWKRNFQILATMNSWEGGANANEQQARRTRAKREARASIKGKADQMVRPLKRQSFSYLSPWHALHL